MKTLLFTAFIAAFGAGTLQAAQVEERNGVQFVTGGVGDDERAQLDGLRKDFNLELVFAAKDGAYLANVEVTLLDAGKREVLRATSDGPRLMARLAPGRYTVIAKFGGMAQTRSVTLAGKGTTQVALYWKDPS